LPFDHHRHGGADVFLGDVRDATAVTEAAAHVDGIIHLAAVLGTQETITNPRPAAEANILGALNVFEAAVQYDLPVVYAGVGNHWMREHGTGAYTISKTAAEDFARMYDKYRGGRISVVRPVNAYGPRQSVAAPFGTSKVRKITPAFICRALSGMPIEIYGSGNQVSDMVYVGDVARVMVAALGSNVFGPIGVGPTESKTVNEIANIVNALAYDHEEPPPLVHLPMRPGEVPDAVVSADTTHLADLGIDVSEFVDVEDGLELTVDWYAKNEGTAWHRPQ
jgi:UDP-glucose 4-epimerase